MTRESGRDKLIAYVAHCDESVHIEGVSPDLEPRIVALGGVKTGRSALQIRVEGEADKAFLFSRLRDLGVAFSGGRDWCPDAQFAHLRTKGLLSGPFLSITWTAPGQFTVREA